jgi:hypothetical protein
VNKELLSWYYEFQYCEIILILSYLRKASSLLTRYRYGPAAINSDSAVNIMLDVVKDQSGKTYKVDHWARRYPTSVVDIANFLVRFSG